MARLTCEVYTPSEPAAAAPAIGAKVRKLRAKSAISKRAARAVRDPPDL